MTSTGRIRRVALLVFALLIFCAAPVWSQGSERKVEASWDFSTATTTLGWTPVEPVSGFGLSNGALLFPATEQAWAVFSPTVSVSTAPLQLVEIEMSSDTAAGAALSVPFILVKPPEPSRRKFFGRGRHTHRRA
jgi:hypothetical protein